MAEIIIDIRGADLRGLYATFSITTPRITVAITTTTIERYHGIIKSTIAKIMNYAAIIKISPCAKFMRRSIPYTIVYPIAMSAYMPPIDMPVKQYERKVVKSIICEPPSSKKRQTALLPSAAIYSVKLKSYLLLLHISNRLSLYKLEFLSVYGFLSYSLEVRCILDSIAVFIKCNSSCYSIEGNVYKSISDIN